MTVSTAPFSRPTAFSANYPSSDQPMKGESTPPIERLIQPTWAEVEEARHRYDREAKRLRFWRWWFLGMFTFFTTLVGILLLELFI